ncbi:MAG TPA: hypothetical protein P5080_00135 [Candidatus Paceibacterota bacterium]|nr:hypothetical protein [Candidatus Pacearchaeota archaeon]HRZ50382.1 hypothetical protein [Candidatus Paceibacterota bacterium]HSA36103.1 hypothetical protein [Candidatus Paceibacterota bacterium]
MDVAVALDFDGTALLVPGGPPFKRLWAEFSQHIDLSVPAMPERMDAMTFDDLIGILKNSKIRRDALKEIAGGFGLRPGANQLFSQIRKVGGTLIILTLNPFGADWINLFLPKRMPNHRIIATVPVWKNGILSDFKRLITPEKKKIPLGIILCGANVILAGDAPGDIEMASLLDPKINPVAASFGFCRFEERALFERAGYSCLLDAGSSFAQITEMVGRIALL